MLNPRDYKIIYLLFDHDPGKISALPGLAGACGRARAKMARGVILRRDAIITTAGRKKNASCNEILNLAYR